MTLGASLTSIGECGILLGVSLGVGVMYIALYFLRIFANNRLLGFILDLLYAIIGGGILVYVQYKINALDIKYYHVITVIIGIAIGGIIPCHFIDAKRNGIEKRAREVRERIRESKLYRIITK